MGVFFSAVLFEEHFRVKTYLCRIYNLVRDETVHNKHNISVNYNNNSNNQ